MYKMWHLFCIFFFKQLDSMHTIRCVRLFSQNVEHMQFIFYSVWYPQSNMPTIFSYRRKNVFSNINSSHLNKLRHRVLQQPHPNPALAHSVKEKMYNVSDAVTGWERENHTRLMLSLPGHVLQMRAAFIE